jgi:tRNA uridine 5-carboxymethylaminomethyl modification enzyme
MVDDLILQGVTEPYRMLTARAEYRLRLRADNAAARLTPQAIEAGCASEERRRSFGRSRAERRRIEVYLAQHFSGAEMKGAGIGVRDDGAKRSLADWLRFPELGADGLLRLVPELRKSPAAELGEAIQDHRYSPYVARQQSEIARLKADETVRIPLEFDYCAVPGLSNEMIERLSLVRPETLGAAARIRGITPAALAAILVQARRKAA